MAAGQIEGNDDSSANRQYQQTNQDRDEEIVQVVYQSDQHGALVGVESTSLLGTSSSGSGGGEGTSSVPLHAEVSNYDQNVYSPNAVHEPPPMVSQDSKENIQGVTPLVSSSLIGSYHEQLSRAASTLPSVAEEPLGNGNQQVVDASHLVDYSQVENLNSGDVGANLTNLAASSGESGRDDATGAARPNYANGPSDEPTTNLNNITTHQYVDIETAPQHAPIYSTIKKTQSARLLRQPDQQQQQAAAYEPQQDQYLVEHYGAATAAAQNQPLDDSQQQQLETNKSLIDYLDDSYHQVDSTNEYERRVANDDDGDLNDSATRIDQEIGHILSRHRAGAVEKGSFRNNFRKKLGLSVSTNENDLTAYRQKLLESSTQDPVNQAERSSDLTVASGLATDTDNHQHHLGGSKFKRTHSVSFNVNSSRSNRHSVDIRNLPSYLTHKRASIVDVAKGAMSSLLSSLGSNVGGSGSASGSVISARERRESLAAQDEEPIFEEPIAPTLSLGQRVAMVRNIGAEFGTVGWIGQFPDVDDDWIVGVIFDNMIGDCDGAYNGVRYFYARQNYAMFVPLSTLTKTDNYIGRPETGTMLSRMSVSLKPGQLISIQRSSIRLQHCFLNAPHQRVGHDVRAVSNRLHCQCHNCGPCAHLTKQQGRINALPHFGSHHLPHKKKNSLAHAAVEMLAHHHHHFHEEEEHDEKDYEFGDNAAHACNFVRYSCCQQNGSGGHEFSKDCQMVRPELLDNLIHAPKAPHRRQSRPRRQARARKVDPNQQPRPCQIMDKPRQAALEGGANVNAVSKSTTLEANQSTLDRTIMTSTIRSCEFDASGGEPIDQVLLPPPPIDGDEGVGGEPEDDKSDQSSYLSSHSSSDRSSRSGSPGRAETQAPQEPYNYYTYDTSSFRPTSGVYNTINSQISFLDQQRFVYQRDSAAFMQSPKNSDYSDASNFSEQPRAAPSLGIKRILRCLGCLSQNDQGRRRRRRRRRPRKLSFRDRVLEYRRRQSTFVPSTLAKPHEDFASHGIMLPRSTANSGVNYRAGHHHNQSRGGEINSDYSSCSRSSCSTSRSNSPPNHMDAATACLNTTIPMQTQDQHLVQRGGVGGGQDLANQWNQTGTMALEHEQSSSNYQLKSGQQYSQPRHDSSSPYQPQLNYGDFTFGDGYQSYEKQDLSKDSAMTDLNFTDTYKSNSSSDTLKHLVDQSINEQVSFPQPLPANFSDMISPLSSASARMPEQGAEQESPNSGQYEVSSPTASIADIGNAEVDHDQEEVRRELEDFSFEHQRRAP